ncbi:MAG: hypothetical protein K2P78_04145 [Gemmataceae bacterium]|nr:hypothetical protein [Gemmataceae bacterium]MBY0513086.1 hypothetical protein [Gemmataceae bacterium]
MADADESAAWNRQAVGLAFVRNAITGETIDPLKLIPERLRPKGAAPPPKTEGQERHETQRALDLIGAALAGL